MNFVGLESMPTAGRKMTMVSRIRLKKRARLCCSSLSSGVHCKLEPQGTIDRPGGPPVEERSQ